MVSHVAFGSETLTTALWALKGPLVSMNPHVDSEILLLTEGFAAAWMCTLIGLGPVVQMEMGVEPQLTGESFVASSVWANVPCAFVAFLGA